jgi:hypothetical protein
VRTRCVTWVYLNQSRNYICISAVVTPEALQRLRELVEQGKLAVVLDSCWDMGDVEGELRNQVTRRGILN